MVLPNRIVIGAVDSALAHANYELSKFTPGCPTYAAFKEQRDGLQEARDFIVANRKEPKPDVPPRIAAVKRMLKDRREAGI